MEDVLFITEKPPRNNVCHQKFMNSINAVSFFMKHYLNRPRILSTIVDGYFNSLRLPSFGVYVADGFADLYPLYFRRPKGKKIMLMAEDTIYKMQFMNKIKLFHLKRLLNSVDGFITVSCLCRNYIRKYSKKPIMVAYPFPHRDYSKIKSDCNTKNILFIGTNALTKGFYNLVEAVKILRSTDDEWNLYIVGNAAKNFKSGDGITSGGGFVSDAKLRAIIEKCSFYAHPAYFDPCPATVFETMSAGLIPVITNNVGQAELFDGALKNLILEDNLPGQIAEKFRELDPKRCLFQRRTKKFAKNFTESKRIKIFKKNYIDFVNKI